MASIAALIGATHPEASLVVTAAMTALGLSAGLGWQALLLAAAVLAGQFSVGLSNDWIDRHRDRDAGRTDKPLVTGRLLDATVLRAAVASLLVCAVLSLGLGPPAAATHLLAVSLGWAYNLDLKFRLTSVLPYAGAFGLLPLIVGLAAGDEVTTPAWLMAAAACLGAGAHFAQVLPDLVADAEQGVEGLPQRLGPRWSLIAAAILLGTASLIVTASQQAEASRSLMAGLAVILALVATVVVAGLAGRARLGFRLTLLVALGTVGLLVAGGSPYA